MSLFVKNQGSQPKSMSSMSKRDLQILLEEILRHSPYCHWQKSHENNEGDHYRDYQNDNNPHLQLSVFGLYDFQSGHTIKSLFHIAKELGVEEINMKNNNIESSSSSPSEIKRDFQVINNQDELIKYIPGREH